MLQTGERSSSKTASSDIKTDHSPTPSSPSFTIHVCFATLTTSMFGSGILRLGPVYFSHLLDSCLGCWDPPSCFNTLCYLSLSSITPSHSNAYTFCISAKAYYVRASSIHSNVLKTNKHLQRVLTNLKTFSQHGTRSFTEVLFSKTS